ncbi:MAG: VPLPA-CTERM sorting domain-containing protein [Deltaproteobacteria bacterium]|nr:VPLPA-CTERM sorting domain-containing protein [Deltaproteobacteria bacterium]
MKTKGILGWLFLWGAILGTMFVVAPSAEAYIETFDSGNAAWLNFTVTDSGALASSSSFWSSSGGNPGGHVTGTVDAGTDGTRLYGIQAPFETDVFGDLTGKTLKVDYRIDGTVTGPVGASVRFYFGYFDGQSRYWVSNDTYSWEPNSDTSWTTHNVTLSESNFILWPNQNKGDKTFAEVLGLYNDIGLVFADGFEDNQTLGFSGTATIHVDNFSAVPIPGAMWLLGSSLIGLAGLRRKFQN